MFTDSHCHIYKEYYDDINAIIRKSEKNGINKFINNACNLESCYEVVELSNKYENMYCVLGLHPSENLEEIDKVLNFIKDNINDEKVIGIGEIGLDYYWNKDNKSKQIEILKRQLDFAQEYNLPVVIHSRESTGEILEILKSYKLKGIIHCFNGSVEIANEFIKLGYKLGINGVITFNNCKLIEVIKCIGVDDLVFETDSPYLTPAPDRGKKNDPSYINSVIDYISVNLNISKNDLANISNKNISYIFDI